MLPKMNRVEILKKIRAESRFAKTPVIVFTNAYVPNMINESFQAGATLVFNKATLTPRQIVDSLQNVLCFSSDGSQTKPNPDSDRTEGNSQDPAHTGGAPHDGEAPFHVSSRSMIDEPMTPLLPQTATAVLDTPAQV